MPRYEYKIVPAPNKGQKTKDIKTPEGRFALSVEEVLNEMGALGWEYLRAELLPSEERTGLTGSTTNWRNLLVFRRLLEDESAVLSAAAPHAPARQMPPVAPAPVAPAPVHQPAPQLADQPDDAPVQEPPLSAPAPDPGAAAGDGNTPAQFPDRRR